MILVSNKQMWYFLADVYIFKYVFQRNLRISLIYFSVDILVYWISIVHYISLPDVSIIITKTLKPFTCVRCSIRCFGRIISCWILWCICIVCQKKKRRRRNIPNNSKTNYRREIKLIPINIILLLSTSIWCFKISLGVHLHGDLYLNLMFSM